MTDQEAGPHQ